jgi:2-methylisocitrate lyase-like PEP mutase family enzyme
VTTSAQQIRDAVAADTVLMPGVYDALTARIAARVGFDVVFISGYSVSAARLG